MGNPFDRSKADIEALVGSVMKAVWKLSNEASRGRKWMEDEILSEAMLGALGAAHNYDPSRGFRFSTYAFRAIHSRIGRAIVTNARKWRNQTRVEHEYCLRGRPFADDNWYLTDTLEDIEERLRKKCKGPGELATVNCIIACDCKGGDAARMRIATTDCTAQAFYNSLSNFRKRLRKRGFLSGLRYVRLNKRVIGNHKSLRLLD